LAVDADGSWIVDYAVSHNDRTTSYRNVSEKPGFDKEWSRLKENEDHFRFVCFGDTPDSYLLVTTQCILYNLHSQRCRETIETFGTKYLQNPEASGFGGLTIQKNGGWIFYGDSQVHFEGVSKQLNDILEYGRTRKWHINVSLVNSDLIALLITLDRTIKPI
jgi:hypothetical protein